MLITFAHAYAHAIGKKTRVNIRGKIAKLIGCHLVLLHTLLLNSILLKKKKRKRRIQTQQCLKNCSEIVSDLSISGCRERK